MLVLQGSTTGFRSRKTECHTQDRGLNFIGSGGVRLRFLSRKVTCLSLCHVDLFGNGREDGVEWGVVGARKGDLFSLVEARDGRSRARGEAGTMQRGGEARDFEKADLTAFGG